MAWTPITAATSWQDLAIATEIAYAYDARVYTLTSAERTTAGVAPLFASSDPTEDTCIFDLVKALQSGIAKLYSYFADPTTVLHGYAAAFPYLDLSNYVSLAAMMSTAGLTKSGYWRRIPHGGTQPATWSNYSATGWSYGAIQNGDLAGPWLWIDLQNALSALKRRIFDIFSSTTYISDVHNYKPASYTSGNTPHFPWAPPTSLIELNHDDHRDFIFLRSTFVDKLVLWAARAIPPKYIYSLSVEVDPYQKFTVINLPAQKKNIHLLGGGWMLLSKHQLINTNFDGTDFDSGVSIWGDNIETGYDFPLNIMHSTLSTTATSIEYAHPLSFSTLSTLFQVAQRVPWPYPPPQSQYSKGKRNVIELCIQPTLVATDYLFDN